MITNPSPLNSKAILSAFLGPQSGQCTPGSSATVMSGSGIYTGAFASTDASSSNVVITGLGRAFLQTSGATLAYNTATFSGDDVHRMDAPCVAFYSFGMLSYSNVRFFLGMGVGSTIANYAGADTLATPGFGIQFSTDRGDTTFQVISYNGTTQTRVSTSVTPAINTLYTFKFEIVSATEVVISIFDKNGVLLDSKTVTATLPASTADLRLGLAFQTRAAVAISSHTYSISGANLGYKQFVV